MCALVYVFLNAVLSTHQSLNLLFINLLSSLEKVFSTVFCCCLFTPVIISQCDVILEGYILH